MSARSLTLLLVSLSFCAGCASVQSSAGGDPDYALTAKDNLALGNEALESRDFVRAERYFEYVRTKYPFLDAATEAELRIADMNFTRELYTEARDGYQAFVKLHPTHPKVDYAAYRAAFTHVEDMPNDLFFLPPSEEKDQGEVRSALQALNDFLRQYPKSQYVPEVETALKDVRRRLAEHELYAAHFYARRKRWPAVTLRLEGLLEKYPGTPFEEEALFDLHDAYVKQKKPEQAQATLRKVIERMPGTPAASKAQRLLGS